MRTAFKISSFNTRLAFFTLINNNVLLYLPFFASEAKLKPSEWRLNEWNFGTVWYVLITDTTSTVLVFYKLDILLQVYTGFSYLLGGIPQGCPLLGLYYAHIIVKKLEHTKVINVIRSL